jgi:hypothetical protein
MDENGEMVHRFTLTMSNLGLALAGHELVLMLDSNRWRRFSFGGVSYEFLPGEFDYFLSAQGVTREQVMAVQDTEAKAHLDGAMDERRTGYEGYRRSIADVRAQVPARPGNPIVPYGLTQNEAKALAELDQVQVARRDSLGRAVRLYATTGGRTTRRDNEQRPRWERLLTSVKRLPDDELAKVIDALREEHRQRRRR